MSSGKFLTARLDRCSLLDGTSAEPKMSRGARRGAQPPLLLLAPTVDAQKPKKPDVPLAGARRDFVRTNPEAEK